MKFEWDENKNKTNIRVHEIDFRDAHLAFDHPMLLKIDNRKDYGEERWIGLGKLYDAVVVIVFTKRNDKVRIISIRRANRNERKIYEEKFQE